MRRDAEPIKHSAYITDVQNTKKEEITCNFVHIQLCVYSMPYCLLYSLSNKHENNTWGGKLFVVKEIKTEVKHIFLFHILTIFSSHNSILVFCFLLSRWQMHH